MKKSLLLSILLMANTLFCMEAPPKTAEQEAIDRGEANGKLLNILENRLDQKEPLNQKAQIALMKESIAQCDINFRYPDCSYQTLLMRALSRNLPAVVRFLLEQPGLDVTVKDQDCRDALQHALHSPESLKVLLELNNTLNPKLNFNEVCQSSIPLESARYGGCLEAVKLLCAQEDVDVNIPNIGNNSLLHMAMTDIDADGLIMIHLFADKGANMECLNDHKQTPLHLALSRLVSDSYYIAPNRVIALLALGAQKVSFQFGDATHISIDAEVENYSVTTAVGSLSIQPERLFLDACFQIAVQADNVNFRYRLANGYISNQLKIINADGLNAADAIFGMTALHWAAARGHLELTKLLLAHPEIDVTARDNFGWTALHYAALNGHAAVVELLLKRPEALGELKSHNGKRPYDLAKMRNHKAAGRLLRVDLIKQLRILQYFVCNSRNQNYNPGWRYLPVELATRILSDRSKEISQDKRIGSERDKMGKIFDLCKSHTP